MAADVLVLCYHAVSERWPAPLSVTPAALEEQLGFLVERGYRGVTFKEAVTGRPRGKVVAVTFDDGFRSVAELAQPILERLGLPGTIFVPTTLIGGGPLAWPGIDQWLGGEHEAELAGLTWDELRALRGRGWEIGSHTRTHPRLTELDDGRLAEELGVSRDECSAALGEPCRSLAYPYGDVDGRVVAAARAAGYSCAGALPSRHHRRQPLLWPRVGVYHGLPLGWFRRQVSRPMRALQGSPLWPLADRANRARIRVRRRRGAAEE